MPICQNCKNRWSWSYTMKQIIRFRKKMNCFYCKEVQYESQNSRYKSSFFSLIPSISIPITILLDFSIPILILFYFVLAIGFMATTPYILELSNEDEPFW